MMRVSQIVISCVLLSVSACGGRITQSESSEQVGVDEEPLTITNGPRSVTVSQSAAPPGATLTLSGSGFSPNSSIHVMFDGAELGVSATTDATGAFSLSITIPPAARTGSHPMSVATASDDAVSFAYQVRTSWTQFKNGAAHRGIADVDNIIGTHGYRGGLTEWAFSTGTRIVGSPIVYGAYVYIGNEGGDFFALRWAPSDGDVFGQEQRPDRVFWRTNLGAAIYSTPAAGNSRVIIGTEGGSVLALSSLTGDTLWNFSTGGGVTAPITLAGDTAYAASRDQHVYALDAATGALDWSTDIGGEIVAAPTIYDGHVYVGTLNGAFVALDATAGTLLWQKSLGTPIRSTAAVVSGVAYFGADDARIYALNLEAAGAVKWSTQTGGLVRSSPAVGPVLTYFGSYDGAVHAVRTATGEPVWERDLLGPVRAAPVLANDVVVLGCASTNVFSGYLYMVTADDGSFISGLGNNEGTSQSSPAVANGSVFYGDESGTVRCHRDSCLIPGGTCQQH
jgi:eukaryotic-like serine/threonine-protein kinase